MTGTRLESVGEVDSLVAALVESNDQIVALYDLLGVGFASLDEQTSLTRIMIRGAVLLDAVLELRTASLDPSSIRDYDGDPDFRIGPTGTSPPVAAGSYSRTVELTRPDGRFGCRVTALRAGSPFSTGDIKLLTAVANVVLVAGYISRVHQAEVEHAVIRNDYATASELAKLALPRWQRDVPGLDLFAHSNPAQIAGGDFYQFAHVDDIFWFVFGDVSGKGLPSALIMTAIISASNAVFQAGHQDSSKALAAIDAMVYDYLDAAERFATIIVGRFDVRSRRLALTNAGHSPVILTSKGEITEIRATCAPLGVFPVRGANPIDAIEFDLAEGDRLIVGSDGFTDQTNSLGEVFGSRRFIDTIVTCTGSVRDHHDRLVAALEEFAGSEPQFDDQTLLVLKVTTDRGSES